MYGIPPALYERGLAELVAAHPVLAGLRARNGDPPLWSRPPTFAALVLYILEQQVSIASARAAFVKLHEATGGISPAAFLALDSAELRAVGFSRQKASYCRGIAQGILTGDVDLAALGNLDDDEARKALVRIRGIGPWTADVFLLFSLGRPDAWPSGDRALQVAMGRALGLIDLPDADSADAIASRWRPWRGIAAFLFWHDYLGGDVYQDDARVGGILG